MRLCLSGLFWISPFCPNHCIGRLSNADAEDAARTIATVVTAAELFIMRVEVVGWHVELCV